MFVLAASDAAQDLIADFKPVIDQLVVTDPTVVHASATEIGSYIAGATGRFVRRGGTASVRPTMT